MKLRNWLVASAMVALASASMAEPEHDKGAHEKERHRAESRHHVARMAKALDLTDEQREVMKEAIKAEREANGMHESRLDKKIMLLDPADREYQARVDELSTEAAEHAAKRVRAAAAVQAKLYAVLTEAQRVKWAEITVHRAEKRERHRKERIERSEKRLAKMKGDKE